MVRAALGASAGRIVRQLLTESMLLAVVAGAAGATIAAWGVTALLKLIPPALRAQLPYSNSLSVDLRTLLFTAALALATGILFGVAPALRARVAALHSALAEDSRTAAGSRNSLRAGLVVGEVAIAVTLLIGSGLLLETLWRVAHADAGFNSHNLLVGNFAAPFSKYNANDKALQLDQQLQGRLSEIPGVAGAALTTDIPLNGANSWLYFQVQGAPVLPIGQQPLAVVHNATPSYLSTLQVPLLAGRMFTDQDDYSAKVQVAVVNQKMASQYLGGKPLGKILRFTSLPNIPPMEVVGVVADVKESFLDRPDVPAIYLPAAQSPMAAGALVLRTQGDPNNFVPAVREALASVDRDIAVYNTSSMDERIAGSNSMFLRRMPALLVGVFASLALLLSSIGIYGVISYGVVRRTREFGVRMALGATSGAVVRLVLRSGARLTLLGILIGLVTGCVAAQLASSLLFGVKPFDLTVLAATAAAVALVSLTAAFLPAMRAARLQPLSALRHE